MASAYKKMTAAAASTYTPNGDEIKDAVIDALKEYEDKSGVPTVKAIKKKIKKENPNWKVPERRVSKFLKKELKAKHPQLAGTLDDDDESTTSTLSRASLLASRVAGVIRGKSRRNKKTTSDKKKPTTIVTSKKQVSKTKSPSPKKAATPKKADSQLKTDVLLPALSDDGNEAELLPPEPQTRDVFTVEDDGKVDKKPCCEGCAIL